MSVLSPKVLSKDIYAQRYIFYEILNPIKLVVGLTITMVKISSKTM